MKKSVILIIVVLYLAAIAVVSFLGVKMKVYQEKIYVESIVCLNEEAEETPDEIRLIAGLKQPFQLEYKVYPEKATNKKLEFQIVNESIAIVSETGYVTPLKKGVTKLIMRATDGHGAACEIKLIIVE